MYLKNLPILTIFLVTILLACVKYQDYPYLELKDGAGFISTSQTIATNQSFKVSIIATKNNDPLRSVVVTAIYPNDTLRYTLYTNLLTGDSTLRYASDYSFTTRQKSGEEKYTFSVESSSGIIRSQTLTMNVITPR